MEKTAMMQMLEWTRKTFPMDLDTPRMIEERIESLLRVEKEQTIKFSKRCLDKALDLDVRTAHLNVEQYYNETYSNDK